MEVRLKESFVLVGFFADGLTVTFVRIFRKWGVRLAEFLFFYVGRQSSLYLSGFLIRRIRLKIGYFTGTDEG